jgi:arylsulfatase A-like enzyme
MAANPRLGLVVGHLPVPHAPYIYDASTGAFDLRNASASAYFDALQLADRTLGEIRGAMREAGVWENSAVLVSADHGYRESDFGKPTTSWVPFLLKLPGENEPAAYTPEMETLASGGLLLAILEGEVVTAGDVARWLDRAGVPPSATPLR